MSRIVYTLTCTVPPAKEAEWLAWLRGGHMQEVIAGGASSAEIIRIDSTPGIFEIRYIFPDRRTYDSYIRDHAPRLRADGLRRFPPEDGISYSRSAGEIIV